MKRGALGACALLVALWMVAGVAFAAGPVVSGPFARSGKWMVDPQGRVVVMHGVNIVHKSAPFYPNNFTAQDAALLASEGFTTARIGFIWAAVEPKPGVYDDTYIEKVIQFNQLLAQYGIQTLIDFHQDVWGSSSGGDGAPQWATLGPDFLDDFQDFWDNAPAPDGVGIQTHFDNAWKHVAAMLASSPGSDNIVGLDPFNEPYAGSHTPCAVFTPCPPFESGALADFYRGVIAAIRSAGDRHTIFPEGIAQNGITQPSLPKFADPQTAFSFHYYCPLTQTSTSNNPDDAACQPLEQHGVGSFVAYANSLGVPALEGEFSCNDADDDNAAIVDLFDRDFLTWTIWAYYAYAQDPANCSGQGLLVDETKPGSEANAKQAKLDAIVVPYAEAIAGTPQSFSFDRSTNTMTLRYSAQPAPGAQLQPRAPTDIFVPARKYAHGYRATVTGGHAVSAPGATWLEVMTDDPADTVTVTLAPAAHDELVTVLGSSGPSGSSHAAVACLSRRSVLIHLFGVRASQVRSVTVFVDGNRRRTLKGRRSSVLVTLARLPRGTVRVRLMIALGPHREAVLTRAYHTCAAKRRHRLASTRRRPKTTGRKG